MKIKKQLLTMTAVELQKKIADNVRQVAKLRLEKHTGKTKNLRLAFILRKQVAIAKSLLNMNSANQ